MSLMWSLSDSFAASFSIVCRGLCCMIGLLLLTRKLLL
jgi:hypothetical protein